MQLRRLFRVVNGGTPTAEPGNWGGDITWLTPDDLGKNGGQRVGGSARTLTERGLQSANLVPGGSIVLSTRAPIGHIAVADRALAFNQGCKGLVPQQELDERFFYYQLVAKRSELEAMGQGSTFSELSGGSLASLSVVAPPVDQQRRIADFLDHETSRLRAIRRSREHVARLAHERVDAAILNRVVPSSTHWPPGQPLDDLPLTASIDGWSAVRLRYTVEGVQNGVWGDEPRGEPDDSYCIRVADFNYPRGRVGSVSTLRSVPQRVRVPRSLRTGDLLLEKSGGGEQQPVGRVVLWDRELDGPVVCSNFIARMRPRARFDGGYLQLLHRALYLCGITSLSIKQTTGIQNLDAEHYLDRAVSLPELREQVRARIELETLIGFERRTSDRTERQVQLLDERQDAVITAAVTGEVDPSSYRTSAVTT